MIRLDLTDYTAQEMYQAEEEYRRSYGEWLDQQYPPLTPEELEREQRTIALDQALRDEGNFYSRRQDADAIPF